MRFRPVDRRRRFLPGSSGILLFLIFPLLSGGPTVPAAGPSPGSHSPDPPSPPLVTWVFLSDAGWESQDFHRALLDLPAKPRFRSSWLQAVSVEVESGRLPALRSIPGVVGVRPVARLSPLPGLPASPTSPESFRTDSIYGELAPALEALGIPGAHALGFMGTGVRVGILDGSFQGDHPVLRSRPPLATRDFVDLDASVFPDPGDPPEAASHGTALWSLLSGDLLGSYRGGAPGVEILLARIRGSGPLTPVDEDRWVAGLEWLETQGARIVLSGVTFRVFPDSSYTIDELDGDATPATLAADQAAMRGILVVAPVGNGGPGSQSLESPADGDSVLAVGATDSRGVPAAFSALGPTGDGRPKPDLFAPGSELPAASGLADLTLERVAGTEFAGALLAGASALLVEAYPDRGPLSLLEMLRASAPADTGAAVGVPHVGSTILFPEGLTAYPLEELGGEGVVTNLTPQFRWDAPTLHPLGLPVTFFVELAEDSLFRGPLLGDSVVGTFARRIPRALPPRSRLFWRIRARSVQGVHRYSRTRGPISVPAWVDLEVMDDPGGVELQEAQPIFRWSAQEIFPPAGPFVFELQVLLDREADVIQSYPGLEEKELQPSSPLPFNVPLRWRIIASTRYGAADTVTSAGPFVVTSGANPPATLLYQNFPNPFPNREVGGEDTRIWFDLAEPSTVHLAVYDLRGRLVKQLIPADGCPPVEMDPGIYGREEGHSPDPCQLLSWDGTDDRGRNVNSGVYLLRLRAGGVTEVRRMVLWR